jgi:hypothetical protein
MLFKIQITKLYQVSEVGHGGGFWSKSIKILLESLLYKAVVFEMVERFFFRLFFDLIIEKVN